MINNFLEFLWKALGSVLVTLIASALLLIVVFQIKINAEVESKIEFALGEHFSGRVVKIENRDDGPYRQSCYELAVTDKITGQKTKSFAMVAGDNDGGSWQFHKEYGSMRSCIDDYYRG